MLLLPLINPLSHTSRVAHYGIYYKEQTNLLSFRYIIFCMSHDGYEDISYFHKPHIYIIFVQRLVFVFLAILERLYMRCILFYLAFCIVIKETIFWFMVSSIFQRHFHLSETTYLIQFISNFHWLYFFFAKLET